MIRNTAGGEGLLDALFGLNEAALALYHSLQDETGHGTEISGQMSASLDQMEADAAALNREEPALMTENMYRNIKASFGRVAALAGEGEVSLACRKIKYELIPFILDCYTDLYFFGFCYPDREKMHRYYEKEMKQLCPPAQPGPDGQWPFEVSIVVSAYNKEEHTRRCLESIRAYFPREVSHELILVNTGSTDGTKELFESYHPDKQIDMECMVKGFQVAARAVEGRYILFISNDVILTPRAAENLLSCLRSDETAGCVAPTCPNIANCQTIPAEYHTLEEMINFAGENNRPDPARHHQRSRLNPPVLLAPSDSPAMYTFWGYWYPNSPDRFLAFTDDLMAMVLREEGKKAVLALDAYVYHAGSATVKDIIKERDFYSRGRKEFQKTFGLDPWGMDFCYSADVVKELDPSETGRADILSINCGLGDTPLAIQNRLRERHNRQCCIYGISTSRRMQKELPGICGHVITELSLEKALKKLGNKKFAYIVVGNSPALPMPKKTLPLILEHLEERGRLLLFSGGEREIRPLQRVYTSGNLNGLGYWNIYQKPGGNRKGPDMAYYSYVRRDVVSLMDDPEDRAVRVLELGCASGATLAYIRERYPRAETWGIELNPEAAKQAEGRVDHCFCGNCEEMELPGEDGSFDYILCPDVLEHLLDPWKMAGRLKQKLKKGGLLICSVPNVTHWSVLIPYLQGKWDYQDSGILDRTHLHFFTYETALALCAPEGMKHEKTMVTKTAMPPGCSEYLEKLKGLPGVQERERMEAYQYLIASRKV